MSKFDHPDALILRFLASETCLIISVIVGYVVLATIAGYQHLGKFDVYRPATMIASIAQFFAYLAGLALFVWLAYSLVVTA
jgi:hypothetical protein